MDRAQTRRLARRYSVPARFFHWGIALLIFCQIPLAYYMIGLPLSPDKLATYAWHKSLGMTIFGLTACRLAWRWLRPPPPLPAPMTPPARSAARLTHAMLYLLTFTMPIVGWLGSSAANFPVSLFGWLTLPDLVSPDPQLHTWMENTHRALAYLLFATVGIHASAAAYHALVLRDGVLQAMLPAWLDRHTG